MKYRIRLRVYSKTLHWSLHTTPNICTKFQLPTNCTSGDTMLTDGITDEPLQISASVYKLAAAEAAAKKCRQI